LEWELETVTGAPGNLTWHAVTLTNDGVTAQPPTITSFTPTDGLPGDSVTIVGTNFDALASNNTVKFNGTTASVTSASSTSLTAVVPDGATTGTISVTTPGGTDTSDSSFTVNEAPEPVEPPETAVGGNAFLLLVLP
jgi:hypothetical protein